MIYKNNKKSLVTYPLITGYLPILFVANSQQLDRLGESLGHDLGQYFLGRVMTGGVSLTVSMGGISLPYHLNVL
jgi:hypothetical protein